METKKAEHTPCQCEIEDLRPDFAGEWNRIRIKYCPLHASAPELLESAQEALQGLYVEHAENCNDHECAYLETYQRLTEAITKATEG